MHQNPKAVVLCHKPSAKSAPVCGHVQPPHFGVWYGNVCGTRWNTGFRGFLSVFLSAVRGGEKKGTFVFSATMPPCPAEEDVSDSQAVVQEEGELQSVRKELEAEGSVPQLSVSLPLCCLCHCALAPLCVPLVQDQVLFQSKWHSSGVGGGQPIYSL